MIGGVVTGVIHRGDYTVIVVNGMGHDSNKEMTIDVLGIHPIRLEDDIWWQSDKVMWSRCSADGNVKQTLKRRRLTWDGKVIQ